MRFLVLILGGLTLLSCGGKTRSSGADIKVIPEQPIVIAADRVRGDITDTGPWFQYTLSMTNNDSSSAITVAAIKVTINGVDASGAPVVATGSHTAGELDTTADATTGTPECKFINFKPIAAGETALLSVDAGTDACKKVFGFLDTNAPGGKDLTTYRYRVKLELIGWFGPDNAPEERFQKTFNFTAH